MHSTRITGHVTSLLSRYLYQFLSGQLYAINVETKSEQFCLSKVIATSSKICQKVTETSQLTYQRKSGFQKNMVILPCSAGDNAKYAILKWQFGNKEIVSKYSENIYLGYCTFCRLRKFHVTGLRNSAW